MRRSFWILFITFSTIGYSQELVETKCVAHRGNTKYELENSISAIVSAYDVGADGIEVDVRHTIDGYPILLHDRTLNGVAVDRPGYKCPLKKNVSELFLFTIRKNCLLKNGEVVPTLFDALGDDLNNHLEFFLELKDSPSEKTIELIKSSLSTNRKINIISFKTKILKRLSRIFSVDESVAFYRLYLLYVSPDRKYGSSIMYTRFNYRRVKKNKQDFLNGIWTIDNEQIMKSAFDHNIGFITTNDPFLCVSIKKMHQKINQ